MTWLLDRKIHSTVVSNFIASSMELASNEAPTKWGLTEKQPGCLRLNVGFSELLTTRPKELRVLLDASIAFDVRNKIQLSLRGSIAEPFYRSVPRSQLLTVPYLMDADLTALLAAVRKSHEAIVRTAATRGFNNGAKRGHSNRAVESLAAIVGRDLPYPGYAVPCSVCRPLPEEVSDDPKTYSEGALRRVLIDRYERDHSARRRCLEARGSICEVCRRDLAGTYGAVANGLIHVHHLVPLADVGESYEVDPEKDLVPVCPNCHAVIHLRRERPFTPEEVRRMLDDASSLHPQNPATPDGPIPPLRGSIGR